jgi:hypothetical protein
MVRDVDPFLPDPVWPQRLANSALFVLATLGALVITGMAVCTGMSLSVLQRDLS